MGHLTYHTGPFNAAGDLFDGITNFVVDVVNADPPLGRPIEVLHRDIGTLGEAQVARRLLDSDGVEILLNPAHNYLSYRDFALDYVAKNGRPLMPSVHGGAIGAEYGGVAEEPLFRGSPMDSAQGTAAVVHAHERGARNVVIVASEIAGAQLQKDGAARAAEGLGMEVLADIDFQAQAPSHRSVIGRIASLDPDAVVFFSPGEEWRHLRQERRRGGQLVDHRRLLGLAARGVPRDRHHERDRAARGGPRGGLHPFGHPPHGGEMERLWRASEYSDVGEPSNSYALQYYDLIVLTALAIEAAGSTDPAAWSQKMYELSDGDGEEVFTYAEGLAALREGRAIDYQGVTGGMEYTDTGVVSGLFRHLRMDRPGDARAGRHGGRRHGARARPELIGERRRWGLAGPRRR